jgi:L-fuconolactonase
MARVDAHLHVWDLDTRPQPWTDDLPALRRSFALTDVRADQAAAGVARTVLVQCVADVDETRELLALADAEAAVAGVVGWLDLSDAGFADALDELRAAAGGALLVGLRHQLQVEPDPAWLDRPAVHSSLRALGERGLTYDVVVSPSQLVQVTRTVAALPDVRFVLDHCGNPPVRDGVLGDWRRATAALARHDNVGVKLSGLATHGVWGATTSSDLAPVVEHVLGTFGPDRTMFGSDWPVCLLGTTYGEVVELADDLTGGLAPAERDAVWSGTADLWYGLMSGWPDPLPTEDPDGVDHG